MTVPEVTPARYWAYAYQMVPPQSEARLRELRALLAEEDAVASRDARTWQGRFVSAELATHILIVASTPDQELDANRRIEAALARIGAHFVRTLPMPVEA